MAKKLKEHVQHKLEQEMIREKKRFNDKQLIWDVDTEDDAMTLRFATGIGIFILIVGIVLCTNESEIKTWMWVSSLIWFAIVGEIIYFTQTKKRLDTLYEIVAKIASLLAGTTIGAFVILLVTFVCILGYGLFQLSGNDWFGFAKFIGALIGVALLIMAYFGLNIYFKHRVKK